MSNRSNPRSVGINPFVGINNEGYSGYSNISDTNDTHTKKVDDLIKNNKYFKLICKIDFGIKTIQEKIADKQSVENPINEIIYNFFSTDYFFLILFL